MTFFTEFGTGSLTNLSLIFLRLRFPLSGLLRLLRKQNALDVGEDTALGNCDARQEFVQLLVIPDGQLQVPRDDPSLLVVPCSVASQLENLSGEVLHDSSQVDRGTSTHTLGIVALAKETVDTSHGELEACPVGTGLCFSLDLSTFATARHFGRANAT